MLVRNRLFSVVGTNVNNIDERTSCFQLLKQSLKMLLTTKYFKRQFKREEPILLVAICFAMHEQETVANARQTGKFKLFFAAQKTTRPSSRRLQQACCQPVVECRRQAACQMRSRGMLRPVVTCLLQIVVRSGANCCDRTAAVLLETNLLHPVVTELPQ